MRAIAQRAGVDPSLVIQHYGSKSDLFAIAVRLPRGGPGRRPHRAPVRRPRRPAERAAARDPGAGAVHAHRARGDPAPCATSSTSGSPTWPRASDRDDAELRAALTVSSILGLTVARHFLKLDALATEFSGEQIETVLRPWLTAALGEGIAP